MTLANLTLHVDEDPLAPGRRDPVGGDAEVRAQVLGGHLGDQQGGALVPLD